MLHKMLSDAELEAYTDGEEACYLKSSANPHEEGSKLHRAWDLGFENAKYYDQNEP